MSSTDQLEINSSICVWRIHKTEWERLHLADLLDTRLISDTRAIVGNFHYLAFFELPEGESYESLSLPDDSEADFSDVEPNIKKRPSVVEFPPGSEPDFSRPLRRLGPGEHFKLCEAVLDLYDKDRNPDLVGAEEESRNVIDDARQIPNRLHRMLKILSENEDEEVFLRRVPEASNYGVVDPFGDVFPLSGRYAGKRLTPEYHLGKQFVKLTDDRGVQRRFLVSLLLDNARKSKKFSPKEKEQS